MSKKCLINVTVKPSKENRDVNMQFVHCDGEDMNELFFSFTSAINDLIYVYISSKGSSISYTYNDKVYEIANFQNFKAAILAHLGKELNLTVEQKLNDPANS